MVEYNHDEERLVRIEQMVKRLQREQTALTLLTKKRPSPSPSDRGAVV